MPRDIGVRCLWIYLLKIRAKTTRGMAKASELVRSWHTSLLALSSDSSSLSNPSGVLVQSHAGMPFLSMTVQGGFHSPCTRTFHAASTVPLGGLDVWAHAWLGQWCDLCEVVGKSCKQPFELDLYNDPFNMDVTTATCERKAPPCHNLDFKQTKSCMSTNTSQSYVHSACPRSVYIKAI